MVDDLAKRYGPTDQRTNRPTDGRTDKSGCRVAYHAIRNTLIKLMIADCRMVNTRPGDLAAPQREREKDSTKYKDI